MYARPDGVTFEHGHAKGDVALRGTAGDLLLWAWNRVPVDDRFEVFGDPDRSSTRGGTPSRSTVRDRLAHRGAGAGHAGLGRLRPVLVLLHELGEPRIVDRLQLSCRAHAVATTASPAVSPS